jgi:hypothetical protein
MLQMIILIISVIFVLSGSSFLYLTGIQITNVTCQSVIVVIGFFMIVIIIITINFRRYRKVYKKLKNYRFINPVDWTATPGTTTPKPLLMVTLDDIKKKRVVPNNKLSKDQMLNLLTYVKNLSK